MKGQIKFVKSTVLGGLLFLVPIAVLLIVVGKLVGLFRAMANQIAPFLPVDSFEGVIALNLIAILALILLCFLFGMVAQSALGEKVRTWLDDGLLGIIPGYAFVKGITEGFRRSDEISTGFTPIAVRLDDYVQLAFEIERGAEGMVAVYLPGAPNPWSGAVVYVEAERVRKLKMTVPQAIKNIQRLGKGSMSYVEQHGKLFASGENGSTDAPGA